MPDDVFPLLDGSVDPPNGRVTQAALYKALYDLDQGLSRRFTVFLEIVAGLRDDLEEHRADGHPQAQREETVREELRLDAKRTAMVTAALGLLAAAAGFLGAVAERALS